MGDMTTHSITANKALQIFEKGTLVLPSWQRGYVWTAQNRTNFVVSMLENVYMNYLHIFVDSETNLKNLMDGGNRLRTLNRLVNDEIKIDLISDNKMDVIVDIGGDMFILQDEIHRRYFSRWDPKLKNHILNYVFKYNLYNGYDIKEIKGMFSSLNMNKKLTNQEIRTTKESEDTIVNIDKLLKDYDLTKYMPSKNSLLKHARNKEFMYMCIITILHPEKSLTASELDRYINSINKEFPDEDMRYAVKVLDYLNTTIKYIIECKVKGSVALVNKKTSTINFLNKSTGILLVRMAKNFISNNITPKVYSKFIVEFWLSDESSELDKMSSGVQKYLVDKRFTILDNFYNDHYNK